MEKPIFDMNDGIAAYASSFGNNENRLVEWCSENNTTQNKQQIIEIVHKIEDEVMRVVFNGEKTYSGNELEELILKISPKYVHDIKPNAIKSLLDNIAWMSWHEGYLK